MHRIEPDRVDEKQKLPSACVISAARPEATLRLAVGIATAGRAPILVQMLQRLAVQTRTPDAIFVCAPSASDVAGALGAASPLEILIGPRGSCHQRNAILRALPGYDAVVFFDDDFVPSPDYLEEVERILTRHADVVMTTGRVLKDGILGPGLTFEDADAILRRARTKAEALPLQSVFNGYGCNMSVRLAPVHRYGVGFDEALPLYGWLEDVDFSQQLARYGSVIKADATTGVHLGIKVGRQPGTRLGYSQVANPLYLIRKGTMSWRRALHLMCRNVAANMLRSLRPEPWVDRRGRLRGNLRAFLDVISGRLDPSRALTL